MKNAALLLALSLTVPLAGCFGGESTPPPPPPGPVETFLINAAPGASTTVDDPQFGPQVHVLLEDNFISASGENCRRATVRSQRQEAEVVVICRDGQGVWRLAPRVWGQGLTPPSAEKTAAPQGHDAQKHDLHRRHQQPETVFQPNSFVLHPTFSSTRRHRQRYIIILPQSAGF